MAYSVYNFSTAPKLEVLLTISEFADLVSYLETLKEKTPAPAGKAG